MVCKIFVTLESAKDIFEKELLALKNKEGAGLELLMTYVKYLKWIRDSFPSSKDKALQLLEVFRIYTLFLHKLVEIT